MGLRGKFNISLFGVFVIGLVLLSVFSWQIIRDNARTEVINEAQLITAEAIAVRGYTVNEIQPLLAEQSKSRFLPHTIPAFAATSTQRDFSKTFPNYSYKEAALNPTNPGHRATPEEAAIIEEFRKDLTKKTIITTRETPAGTVLSVSRPMQITNGACLSCHSVPSAAPASMIDVYGPANGFGWNLNEVIGAQIVTVPMHVALNRANSIFVTFIGGVVLIFAVVMVLLNILLHFSVIRPIRAMSDMAVKVSTGEAGDAEFTVSGKDEISSLAQSFNRLKRSLSSAMKMLET